MIGWLRANTRLIVVSDTFIEFAEPLMRQLDYPTLFSNFLEIDKEYRIIGDYSGFPVVTNYTEMKKLFLEMF